MYSPVSRGITWAHVVNDSRSFRHPRCGTGEPGSKHERQKNLPILFLDGEIPGFEQTGALSHKPQHPFAQRFGRPQQFLCNGVQKRIDRPLNDVGLFWRRLSCGGPGRLRLWHGHFPSALAAT